MHCGERHCEERIGKEGIEPCITGVLEMLPHFLGYGWIQLNAGNQRVMAFQRSRKKSPALVRDEYLLQRLKGIETHFVKARCKTD